MKSRRSVTHLARLLMVAAGTVVPANRVQAAAAPSIEVTMQFAPRQRDVEYEIPKPADFPKCKVEGSRQGKSFSWVVTGPEGQILRKFTDSDGDEAFDQWRYYQHGIEVYRDIDTNRNGKADQARWLNLGGSRWGVDLNEDGVIDRWNSLSAAEASRVAIFAMVAGDMALLQTVMITADDTRAVSMNPQLSEKLMESASSAITDARAIMQKSKGLTPQSRWVRFDAQLPGVIPADEGKSKEDLYVYENAMVVVESGGAGSQPTLIQIGEMIRVGDVWKLTRAPTPIDGNSTITAGGLLMQPLAGDMPTDLATAPSPAMQKMIEELQRLDQNQPQPGVATPVQLATYHEKRADMLMQLMSQAGTEEEKVQFLKQCVDGVAAAVQTDAYPAGLARLREIESEQGRVANRKLIVPYVSYRRIMSEYSIDMRTEDAEKRQKIQEAWLKSLEGFVASYPESDDAADGMLQLAVAQEFSGKLKEANEWYTRLAKEKTGSTSADKAQGAIRRLDMKGKPFALSGKTMNDKLLNTAMYRGKTLVVFYWATWCQPCQADLPALRALYQQYQSRGFEVVGVCLDIPAGNRQQQVAQLQQYLTSNKVPWPQIYEEGGLDSAPAVQYGIISLPTMFLIDDKGTVVSRSSSVDELKTVLPQLLSGKQANAKN